MEPNLPKFLFCMLIMCAVGFAFGHTVSQSNHVCEPIGSHTIITITNLPPGVSNIIIYPAGPGGGAGR